MSHPKILSAFIAVSLLVAPASPAFAACSIAKLTTKIQRLTRAMERAQRQAEILLGETPKEQKCEARKVSVTQKTTAKRQTFQSLPKVAGCFSGADDPASSTCVKAFNKDQNFERKLTSIAAKDCEDKGKFQKRLRAIARADRLAAKIAKLGEQLLTCGGDIFDFF